MITANLCKCNNCESILIDKNPQINAKEYPLTGNEIEMQWTDGLNNDDPCWVCPTCMTDDYLIDF